MTYVDKKLKDHNEYLLNEVIIPNPENKTAYFVDHTGEKHGKLTAVKYLGINKNYSYKKVHYYLFECECGNEIIARYDNVKNGKTTSCGCVAMEMLIERSTTHLLCHTRLYRIYYKIIMRCYNKADQKYPLYGGRGIRMCDEWLERDENRVSPGFLNFYNWAMENGYEDKLSIDRIDVDGPYCPENCRWADNKMQTNNQQRTLYIYYRGWIFPIKIWSEITGISTNTIMNRIDKGWSIEQVLRIPPGCKQFDSKYLVWDVSSEYLKYHRPDKEHIAIK